MRFTLLTLSVAPFVIAGVVVGVAVSPNDAGLGGLQRRCSGPGEYCTSPDSCCPGSRCLADWPHAGVCKVSFWLMQSP
ncbi:hypothetical protein EDD16DRAFT_1596014 [Pisolithus croceorrhizus]|nr:hypothetical protein EV401DRAFT_366134 [Pisolithus croceorrhizus]KAI6115220.1 hypothetical protein EDD16DRAFT_1596014 [Pisolithus croceorrhizus]